MTFLITGASHGIGEVLANYYQAADHEVIGCGRSDTGAGDYYKCDITDEDAVARLAACVRREYKTVDVLVNCAGVASMNHFLTTPPWGVRQVMNVNFNGTVFMCQAFARLMRAGGRIINFTTAATPWHLEGEALYASSKAAVEELTKVLARELASFNITVNAVGPGPVDIGLIRGVSDDKIVALVQRQAIKRRCTVRDIANVIDFFVKPESAFVTGQIVYLGGAA